MEFKIEFKERLYLVFRVIISLLVYATISIVGWYAPPLLIFLMFLGAYFAINLIGHLILIGYLKGNTIKVNQKQFPEIFDILKVQSEKLGLKAVPAMYLLEGGGMLNAFATRFKKQNYIILFSDVLACAYQEGLPAVKFIIGHELGHIKRNHVSFVKEFFLLPADFFPLLAMAYSRACEYTCDNIGYNLCPEGAEKGLLILAAGRELYKKINIHELLSNAQSDSGFTTWFAELFSTHPHLVKRIAVLNRLIQNDSTRLSPLIIDNNKTIKQELDNQLN